MIRSHSFGEPLSLDCELYQYFSVSPNFRGLELDIPFLQVSYALIKSQKVIGSGRTISSEKQALLRRIKCSGTFQIGSFSLPPAWSKRDFSPVFTEYLVKLLEVKLTKCRASLWRGPPGDFISDLSTLSIQQIGDYSWGFPILAWFPRKFLLVSFCSGKLRFSFFTCLSPILGAAICPVTSLLWWI